MTASTRNSEASKSFLIYVVDKNTGKLIRTAIPSDLQVGLKDAPAELQVHGRLSVSSDSYAVTARNHGVIYVDSNDTIVNVETETVPSSGRVSVVLPSQPRDGQMVIIKDSSGTSSSTPLDITASGNYLIDDALSGTISLAYGTLGVYWHGNQWRTLFALGTTSTVTGSSSSSDGADRAATYVVLSTTSSLPNERVLTQGTGISIVDGGAGGALTISATGTGSGADVSASYVTIGNTGSLPNERRLTQGTGIDIVDGGAGSTISIAVKDSVVATITGSRFTGPVVAAGGLSGSLQQLPDGTSYLVGVGSVTITTQSNGQILISGSGGGGSGTSSGGADVSASYVTIGNTGSLPNERRLISGLGVDLIDGGAGSTISVGINNSIVATISGSRFTGPVVATAGLSGSLHHLADGTSYLVGAGSITITTQSNGQILISGSGGSGSSSGGSSADVSASYIVIGATGSLPNERVLSGSGITITDNGAGSTVVLGVQKTGSLARYHDTTFNPIGLWQLSGSLVDSVNANNMSAFAGTEQYTTIFPGMKALWLDGATTIYSAESTSIMLITGSLTVEFIAVPVRGANAALDQRIVGESGNASVDSTTTNNLWSVAQAATNGRLQYSAEFAAGTNISATSDYHTILGRAVHFAMVRDASGTEVTFYVNGEHVYKTTGLSAPTYAAVPVIRTMIGGAWAATNGYWNGAIASLKITSSSLNPEQIRQEFIYTLGPLYGY